MKRGTRTEAFSIASPLKKNKKGSHVGMIISFTIFITFIVFLYSITKPALTSSTDKKSILENVRYLTIKNVSRNFTTVTISITQEIGDADCVRLLNLLTAIPDYSTFTTIVKDNSQNILTSSMAFADLYVNRLSTSSTFLKTYHSTAFDILPISSPEGCTPKSKEVAPPTYEIGSITVDKYIFENKVIEFKAAYETNYDQLRTDLNIPPGTEFEFTFKKSNGDLITPSGTRRKSSNVYAEEMPIEYIDEEANIQLGFINIQVW